MIQRARQRLGTLRDATASVNRVLPRLDEIERQRAEIETEEHRSAEVNLTAALRRAVEVTTAATEQREAAERQVTEAEGRQPRLRSLAELVQHGRTMGLEEGRCPLCGSNVSEDAFEAHLQAVSDRIEREAGGLSNAVADRETRLGVERSAVAARRQAETALERHRRLAQDLQVEFDQLMQEVRGIEGAPPVGAETSALKDWLENARAQIRLLESNLAKVDASAAYERLIDEERALAEAREELTAIEGSLEIARRAVSHQDQASRVVRRVAGELVDERLAQLEPLLLELYERLRPHIQWSTVGYRVRGDVRRFLRLTVGDDDLNPRFMFSSGQRRALGLAFLLSVHLSTTWSRWNTLVLDDPMQHVDDYRALHLAEVLAAIRKTGKQVLCAVEDDALADLLARRLATSDVEEGSVVRLQYELGEGSKLARIESLPRMVPHVITAA